MTLAEQLILLGLRPDAVVLTQLERLLDELLRWNVRRNLTAIRDRDDALEKHLVDSLTLHPFACRATRLLDLGSGAGFPALPLKITCPALDVVTVDSVAKKIDFQRHVVRLLGLVSYEALAVRIETLAQNAEYRGRFDLVTARALSRLDEVFRLARPFLARQGLLVAMKGPEGHEEAAALARELNGEGWSVCCHELRLPVSAALRCLVEIREE